MFFYINVLVRYLTLIVGVIFGFIPLWVLVGVASYDFVVIGRIPFTKGIAARRQAARVEAARQSYLNSVMGRAVTPPKDELN